MSRARFTGVFAALCVFVTIIFIGCSSGLDNAPKIDNLLGKHPADYVKSHWSDFLTKTTQCETCHGSATDRASAGGISKVSCFSCHADGVSHTSGFADRLRHGRSAAQKQPSDEPASMAGFASCQKCHGQDFKGHGIAVSCMKCHTKAPHPDRPWKGSSAAVSSHHMTARDNASACIQCHKDGKNSTRVPVAPPVPGALPGCFNNTLCHAWDF